MFGILILYATELVCLFDMWFIAVFLLWHYTHCICVPPITYFQIQILDQEYLCCMIHLGNFYEILVYCHRYIYVFNLLGPEILCQIFKKLYLCWAYVAIMLKNHFLSFSFLHHYLSIPRSPFVRLRSDACQFTWHLIKSMTYDWRAWLFRLWGRSSEVWKYGNRLWIPMIRALDNPFINSVAYIRNGKNSGDLYWSIRRNVNFF